MFKRTLLMRALWPIKRLFGTYELVDIRPVQRESKYTFYKPHETEIAALEVGDLVKLGFDGTLFGRYVGSERMWVIISQINGAGLIGTLSNIPFYLDQLKLGQQIEFSDFNIYDIKYEDPDKKNSINENLPEIQEYWDRCIVGNDILYEGAKINFFGRAEPIEATENEPIDSGWFFASEKYNPDEEFVTDQYSFVALGALLNRDDRVLGFLEHPIGSNFLYNPTTKNFDLLPEEG